MSTMNNEPMADYIEERQRYIEGVSRDQRKRWRRREDGAFRIDGRGAAVFFVFGMMAATVLYWVMGWVVL